jgi:hypothetical protein
MISPRKAATNRANARQSTGPRSPEGKSRVSQNARKHGLAVPVLAAPGLAAEVIELAKAIAGPDGADPAVLEAAMRVAAATIDLARIRAARRDVFHRSAHASGSLVASTSDLSHVPAATLRAFIVELEPRLTRLARYEQRAFSRRAAALEHLAETLAGRRAAADGLP